MPRSPRQDLSPKLRAYFAAIGAKGGKKSKRSLSTKEATRIAKLKHQKKLDHYE